jgi:acyl carrier protein
VSSQPSAPSDELPIVDPRLDGHPDIAVAASFRTPEGTRILAAVPYDYYGTVDLRDELWERLPAESLPDLVVVVPALPRDAEGRVRPERIADDPATMAGASGFVAPETPTELALAAIWAEVLGRTRVAAGDNFLDVGGDSMTAVMLLDLVNERLGTDLTFDVLLAVPSLRDLATLIDGR